MPVIENALQNTKYLKPEFDIILKKYSIEIQKLLKLLDICGKNDFKQSKKLYLVEAESFTSNYYVGGYKINKQQKIFKELRKELRRSSKKYY